MFYLSYEYNNQNAKKREKKHFTFLSHKAIQASIPKSQYQTTDITNKKNSVKTFF